MKDGGQGFAAPCPVWWCWDVASRVLVCGSWLLWCSCVALEDLD